MHVVAALATASRKWGEGAQLGRLSLDTVVGGPPPEVGPLHPRVPLRRWAHAHTMLDSACGMKPSWPPMPRSVSCSTTCSAQEEG